MADDQERPATGALVVTAHPDDVDFGAAGTVALWTGSGIEVRTALSPTATPVLETTPLTDRRSRPCAARSRRQQPMRLASPI